MSVSPNKEKKESKNSNVKHGQEFRKNLRECYEELLSLLPVEDKNPCKSLTKSEIVEKAKYIVFDLQKQYDSALEEQKMLEKDLKGLETLFQNYKKLQNYSSCNSDDKNRYGDAKIMEQIDNFMQELFLSFSKEVDQSNYDSLVETTICWSEKHFGTN